MAKEHRVSSSLSDLIHRFAGSCVLHSFIRNDGEDDEDMISEPAGEEDEFIKSETKTLITTTTARRNSTGMEDQYLNFSEQEELENNDVMKQRKDRKESIEAARKLQEMEVLVTEMFDTISGMKRSYAGLQAAHSPWDPEKMRSADVMVVEGFRKLGKIRERYRRGIAGEAAAKTAVNVVVVEINPEVEELRKEVKEKDAVVESLRERLRHTSGRKTKTKRSSARFREVVAAPTAELFESCMIKVTESAKSFSAHLLSLMRAAKWDITAAVTSIESGTTTDVPTTTKTTTTTINTTKHGYPPHAKHAIESYVLANLFHGFENETFYLDGSLSSLIDPENHRRECFTQFRDMQSMDPVELLGILPDCQFGKFSGKKYLAVVHPLMEQAFFGGLEQRTFVLNGGHPRTEFYWLFLAVTKAVWLLHKLAFSTDPPPMHFQASKGAEFSQGFMESVVRIGEESPAEDMVVGFPVSPGFKIGGFVIKARVFLVKQKLGDD